MFLLVTGGSGSGKSAYAEERLVGFGAHRRIYIATMYPFDAESERRVARHRRMRAGKGFETLERYTDLAGLSVPEGACILLECMSNLVANEMYQEQGAGENTVEEILRGVRRLAGVSENLVVVTNEIFSDGVRYDEEMIRYQQYLGEINREMAREASQVVEVVYGIPVERKG